MRRSASGEKERTTALSRSASCARRAATRNSRRKGRGEGPGFSSTRERPGEPYLRKTSRSVGTNPWSSPRTIGVSRSSGIVRVASGTRRPAKTISASWCTTASPSSVSRTSSSNASAPSASARSKLSKVFSSAFVGEPRCPTTRVGEASKKFMLAGLSSRYMSRFARERPEGVVRHRRAARPLPEGPFAVPLSTIDWLVPRQSPGARYGALRDLLGRPPKSPHLRRAKQGFQREPFVREALALLRARLAPGAGAAALERRYDGGVWLALFLTEVGADGALLHLHHAGDVLLARWEKTLVAI